MPTDDQFNPNNSISISHQKIKILNESQKVSMKENSFEQNLNKVQETKITRYKYE